LPLQLKFRVLNGLIFPQQQFYASEKEANEVVRRGKAWGALSFSHNYTESLVERTEYGQNVEDYTVNSAMLDVNLDMSSKAMNFNFSLI
jgi:hypothetical protein